MASVLNHKRALLTLDQIDRARTDTAHDLTGQKFGRLTVTETAGRVVSSGRVVYLTDCECGTVGVLITRGELLAASKTPSCGCRRRELVSARFTKHGCSKSAEYSIWQGAISRCYDKNTKCWPRYGGAGVEMHPAWRSSFATFLKDVGPRPSKQHQLDRINGGNSNYEPGNVRWATRAEQMRNRSNTRYEIYNGERKPLSTLCEELHINAVRMAARVREGRTFLEALDMERRLLSPLKMASEPARRGKQARVVQVIKPVKKAETGQDALGQKRNRLTAKEVLGIGTGGGVVLSCDCDCGSTGVRVARGLWQSGLVRSCGCLKAEIGRKKFTTHGMSHYPEYAVWVVMVDRATNPNNKRADRYVNRGIGVSPEWRESFETFIRDMGRRPSSRHQLERKNNDLGYSKSNCVWATRTEQMNNTSATKRVLFEGVLQAVSPLARKHGLEPMLVHMRLRDGWTIERALSEPNHQRPTDDALSKP